MAALARAEAPAGAFLLNCGHTTAKSFQLGRVNDAFGFGWQLHGYSRKFKQPGRLHLAATWPLAPSTVNLTTPLQLTIGQNMEP